METYTIDAKGKKLGRVASEAAKYLMGKHSTQFARNVVPNVTVTIVNANEADISEKKQEEKEYVSYSGYPGKKVETLKHLIDKRGRGEVFTRAVYGMLPTNKLRSRMIKNLVVKE